MHEQPSVAPQGAKTSGDAVDGLTGNEVIDVPEGLHDGLLRVAVYMSSPLFHDQGADADALTAASGLDVKPHGVGLGMGVAEGGQHRCSTGRRWAVNDGLTQQHRGLTGCLQRVAMQHRRYRGHQGWLGSG